MNVDLYRLYYTAQQNVVVQLLFNETWKVDEEEI